MKENHVYPVEITPFCYLSLWLLMADLLKHFDLFDVVQHLFNYHILNMHFHSTFCALSFLCSLGQIDSCRFHLGCATLKVKWRLCKWSKPSGWSGEFQRKIMAEKVLNRDIERVER